MQDTSPLSATANDTAPGTLLQQTSPQSSSRPKRNSKLPDTSFATRKDNNDGSSQVTVGTNIPTDWQTKVGVDLGLRPTPSLQPAAVENLRSDSGLQNGSSGAAWGNITVPGSPVPMAWDKTSIDARLDPVREQSRFGTTLSGTIPLGNNVSMTVQNGYAVTQTH